MAKILIVEDDPIISQNMQQELTSWDHQVICAQDFEHVLTTFQQEQPDLVLLDLMLPFHNGYYWCQQIRVISTVPLIFLSSQNDNMNIVLAMQYGADDYITKPLNLTVTLAKINALLRRTYDFTAVNDNLTFATVQLDLAQANLTYQNQTIHLTQTELLILTALFRSQGAIVARELIMEQCWQGNNFIDDNTLAVNITRLRKKLRGVNLNDFILTQKGHGYYLNPEVSSHV